MFHDEPRRPTGSDPFYKFQGHTHDVLQRRLIAGPGVRVTRTARGDKLQSIQKKSSPAATTRHPFQIYAIASQPGDAADTTRYRINGGFVEWRTRFPSASLQSFFTDHGGRASVGMCQGMVEFSGTDVSTDIVVPNTGGSSIFLKIIEDSALPGSVSIAVQTTSGPGIATTGQRMPFHIKYQDDAGAKWTATAPIGKILFSTVTQYLRDNIMGQWASTPMTLLPNVSSTWLSYMIYYPGDVIIGQPLHLSTYVRTTNVHAPDDDEDMICTLGLDPNDSHWARIGYVNETDPTTSF